jgi:hypothetical protein
MSRERFDMIYEVAVTSGQFGLNPEDPMYSTVYPSLPRPGRHQDLQKISVCLCITSSFPRVSSDSSFVSLVEEFHISSSDLLAFDKKFWKWFRKEYWETWVGDVSGVDFDDIVTIEREEKLFRRMGLPGFITCMDDVHFDCDHAPYQTRWQYIGKEGYPEAKDASGVAHELEGCMTLCDSGYHNWVETMSGMKHPTNTIEARWTGRYCSMTSCSIQYNYIYYILCAVLYCQV